MGYSDYRSGGFHFIVFHHSSSPPRRCGQFSRCICSNFNSADPRWAKAGATNWYHWRLKSQMYHVINQTWSANLKHIQSMSLYIGMKIAYFTTRRFSMAKILWRKCPVYKENLKTGWGGSQLTSPLTMPNAGWTRLSVALKWNQMGIVLQRPTGDHMGIV